MQNKLNEMKDKFTQRSTSVMKTDCQAIPGILWFVDHMWMP
jgi:hypothetical protein